MIWFLLQDLLYYNKKSVPSLLKSSDPIRIASHRIDISFLEHVSVFIIIAANHSYTFMPSMENQNSSSYTRTEVWDPTRAPTML